MSSPGICTDDDQDTMTGVQALHNISYENGGLRVWRAYDVGPGKFYSAVMLARFGTPQGPTELVTLEPFSIPHIEAGTYQVHPEPTSAIHLSLGH